MKGSQRIFFYIPFLAALAGSTLAWALQLGLGGYFLLMGLPAAALMGWDKYRAKAGGRRVPERALLAWALLGGAAGILLGMFLFRHKTWHPFFRFLVPLLAAGQLLLLGRPPGTAQFWVP